MQYNFRHLIKKPQRLLPTLSIGIESFEFNSKGDLKDANGNYYYYWNDGTIRNVPQSEGNEMNSTTINSTATGHLPIERLSHFDPEVHQRVQQWLASGQLLAWIPILSQENFPDTPPEILRFADQYQEAMRWPIHRPEDLLVLPDGITGWLLPADAEYTDVACGVWNGEVYILGVKDKRTGRQQTLLGERFDVATGQADDPEQSAV